MLAGAGSLLTLTISVTPLLVEILMLVLTTRDSYPQTRWRFQPLSTIRFSLGSSSVRESALKFRPYARRWEEQFSLLLPTMAGTSTSRIQGLRIFPLKA